MSPWLAPAVVSVVLFGLDAALWWVLRRRAAKVEQARVDVALAELLAAVRGRGVRYEVYVVDLGDGVDPDMRWRWAVWDADRVLLLMRGQDTQAGTVVPFMLGNTLTGQGAWAEALRWVGQQNGHASSVVVGGQR